MNKILKSKLLCLSFLIVGLQVILVLIKLQGPKIWHVDLDLVIHYFSNYAIVHNLSDLEARTDFQQKFNAFIEHLPNKVVLIDKPHLLSKQKVIDCTDLVLQYMELTRD